MSSSNNKRQERERVPIPLPVVDLGEFLGMRPLPPGSSRATIRAAVHEAIGKKYVEYQERQAAEAAAAKAGNENRSVLDTNDAASLKAPADMSTRTDPGEGDSRKRPAIAYPSEAANAKRPARHSDARLPGASLNTPFQSPSLAKAPSATSKPPSATPMVPEVGRVYLTGENKSESTAETQSHGTANNLVDAAIAEIAMRSKRRCIPLEPVPTVCSSSTEVTLPPPVQLVNFPSYLEQVGASVRGTKMCAMCGEECPFVKAKKDNVDSPRLILSRNKCVCTVCVDTVWQLVGNKIEFRYCQGCHACLPWTVFRVESGMLKQCSKCRARRRKTKISKRRCIPLEPVPTVCSSSTEVTLPPPVQLVNFPSYLEQVGASVRGTKMCAMCGEECPFVKAKKDNVDSPRLILSRNKCVCTVCADSVWQLVGNKIEFRYCQGCHACLPLTVFRAESGMLKQCSKCRDRARVRKYKQNRKTKEVSVDCAATGSQQQLENSHLSEEQQNQVAVEAVTGTRMPISDSVANASTGLATFTSLNVGGPAQPLGANAVASMTKQAVLPLARVVYAPPLNDTKVVISTKTSAANGNTAASFANNSAHVMSSAQGTETLDTSSGDTQGRPKTENGGFPLSYMFGSFLCNGGQSDGNAMDGCS